ncbi:MAG: hypothetical protein WDA00_06375 [Eubacteriales bacterium]
MSRQKKQNPYATNQGGRINAPFQSDNQPRATVRQSDGDLRSKKTR